MGDLQFDPILHKGYKVIQELEPDLKRAQEDIKWCEHLIVIYPSWWSTMPALLKGFFDRAWIPGFAFHFKKEGLGAGYLWDMSLRGRSATVYVTSDSHPFFARFLFGDTTNEIKRCLLWFAGFFPIRIKKVGPLKFANEAKLSKWRNKFEKWGRKAK